MYSLTNLIKENVKYKAGTKLVKAVANNTTEERKNLETKLLDLEKSEIEY